MINVIKYAVYCMGFAVTSEMMYQLYKSLKKPKKDLDDADVLFFPDKEVACINQFTQIGGCDIDRCSFSHRENSLAKLFKLLSSAKLSLDVCVFVITCDDLTNILISAHQSGIHVRVITDDEQVDVSGSKIWKLRSEGVEVRTDKSSFFMHHKFVIIDGKTLLNGSFNWTRQAITGNQENLMVTNNMKLVQIYLQEFHRLWNTFDPKLLIPPSVLA